MRSNKTNEPRSHQKDSAHSWCSAEVPLTSGITYRAQHFICAAARLLRHRASINPDVIETRARSPAYNIVLCDTTCVFLFPSKHKMCRQVRIAHQCCDSIILMPFHLKCIKFCPLFFFSPFWAYAVFL